MRAIVALLFIFWAVRCKNRPTKDGASDVLPNGPFHIPKTNESAKNENSRVAEDCIITLLHIQRAPLLTTNCCLTRLCWRNGTVLKRMIHDHPAVRGLFYKLCGEKFYLLREQLRGCVFENDRNAEVDEATDSKERIANCSANFQTPTMRGKTEQINSGVSGDSKKRSAKESISHALDSPTSIPCVQTPNSRTADKKIRFENITKISARISGLEFLDVPKGDEMRIHNLRLEEQYLLFEVFSSLMGYLQLGEFPTDLVRDGLQKQVPFHLLAFQLLKTEIAVLVWILLWTILALSIPFVLAIHLCYSNNSIRRLNEDTSDASADFREKCVERTLGFLLHFFLLLLLAPIASIFVANEQISRQMSRSEAVANIIFEDLNTFVRNTHMQMFFVATSSTDATVEAIGKDLEDVEKLLGSSFQEELARETGIDIAFDALDELRLANGEVTSLVANLLHECDLASAAAKLLGERLKEVSRQLTIARQQCRREDRALCYTLQYTGLEVTFSCENLTSDLKIKHLERMEKEKSFNNSVESARITFEEIPQRVSRATVSHIAEIKSVLTRKRTEVYKAAHSLDELARSLSVSIRNSHQISLKILEMLNGWDLWRWLSILGISTMLSLLWSLLLCGAPCGCGVTSRTIPLLLSGVFLTSLMCVVVWSLGTATFLFGVHGQRLLCGPLYDHPHYKALAGILNSEGVLHKDGGIFKALLKANDSFKIEDVLKSCQRNQPAYATFHLHNLFDANSVTNYKSWDDFKGAISNFTIGENNVEILSPSLQLNLQVLSTVSTVNLTTYRLKISGPVTKRDLSSLADQLNTVARQLADLTNAKIFDNLAARVRKIIRNEVAQLDDLKERILYKITALDVLIQPLSRQANRSLSHLKSIQFFADNQGWQIAERTTRQFTSRLENYLENLRNYSTYKVTKEIGKCRPLWEVFHSTRFFICKLIVDPVNGVSVASFALILLFLGIVPVALKLVERYRELINEELLTSITHRRSRDGLVIDDEGTWATPSSETPPDVEMGHIGQAEQPTWTVPTSRQTSEPLIPAPPKPHPSLSTRITSPKISQLSSTKSPKRLSTIASRISAARVPQIPSVSRARSPKRGRYESLRLIEPICWKSGSLSPKSWL